MPPRSKTKASATTLGPLRASRGAGVSRYQQLYELLAGALADGSIRAGEALPSEPDLAARFGLSRTTVRAALQRLESEGRIERRRGSGTYARQVTYEPLPRLQLDEFFTSLPELQQRATVQVLHFEYGCPPASIRELKPRIGPRALVVEWLRFQAGNPFVLTIVYIPEAAAAGLEQEMFEREGVVAVLDARGPRIVRVEHSSTAVAADLAATRHLGVALGTPLLRLRAIYFDAEGRLRGIRDSRVRPDRACVRSSHERAPGRGIEWRMRVRR